MADFKTGATSQPKMISFDDDISSTSSSDSVDENTIPRKSNKGIVVDKVCRPTLPSFNFLYSFHQ